ncbi:MAG: WxL protein peptidoglycan domain-containing protein [Ilumatobacteraceae bacterium]
MAALRRTRRLITAMTLVTLVGAMPATAPAAGASASTETTTPATGDTTAPGTDGSVADNTGGADAGSFAVQPSSEDGPGGRDYFIYTFTTGEQFGDRVAISNNGNEEATFAVYATDAVNTDDGSFSLLREDQQPTDVGTWVELGATQYTLDAGEQVIIPFSISVPADATPGDHVGAIVAQKIADASNPDGIGINVRVRVGARIYARVDGPVTKSLSIDSFALTYDAPGMPFSGNTAKVVYTVTNTGDVRLSPTANLSLAGLFGLGDHTLEQRQIPELLPGSSIEISEVVKDVKPYGRLTADLAVRADEEAVAADATVTQWTMPWLFLAIVIGLLVALIIWRVVTRRRATA